MESYKINQALNVLKYNTNNLKSFDKELRELWHIKCNMFRYLPGGW